MESGELPREVGDRDSDGRKDGQAERGVGLPGQCPGQMSLRAGGGEGPSARIPGRRITALAASSHSSLTPPAPWSLPGAPGSPKVGSGRAETPSRRRLYLRRRLEALQPELRPPPAPRLEWDEAPPAPSPLAFLFPAGACRRGFLRRGPHPSAPPSASQRLALDAAIFHQAASADHQRACVAAAPAVTRPCQLTSALPPRAPPPRAFGSLPLWLIRHLPGSAACAPPRRSASREVRVRRAKESLGLSCGPGATPPGAFREATPPESMETRLSA